MPVDAMTAEGFIPRRCTFCGNEWLDCPPRWYRPSPGQCACQPSACDYTVPPAWCERPRFYDDQTFRNVVLLIELVRKARPAFSMGQCADYVLRDLQRPV